MPPRHTAEQVLTAEIAKADKVIARLEAAHVKAIEAEKKAALKVGETLMAVQQATARIARSRDALAALVGSEPAPVTPEPAPEPEAPAPEPEPEPAPKKGK